jgi:hypothetical protein
MISALAILLAETPTLSAVSLIVLLFPEEMPFSLFPEETPSRRAIAANIARCALVRAPRRFVSGDKTSSRIHEDVDDNYLGSLCESEAILTDTPMMSQICDISEKGNTGTAVTGASCQCGAVFNQRDFNGR